jgi:hypothetical protein
MNVYGHTNSIPELHEQYPELPSGDPTIAMIATTSPNDLDGAIKGSMDAYRIYTDDLNSNQKTLDQHKLIVNEHGKDMQDLYAWSADKLYNVQRRYYTDNGLVPPADLMDQVFANAELAELPADILGIGLNSDGYIHMLESGVEEAKKRVEISTQPYEQATELLSARRKLGRRAKVATWVGGTILTVGLSLGISHVINEASTHRQSEQSEEVAKDLVDASVFLIVGTTSSMGIAALGKRAERNSAHRKANKIITKT